MADSVLPPIPPSGLASVDETLKPAEREALNRDLAQIAACRRRAMDTASDFTIGSTPRLRYTATTSGRLVDRADGSTLKSFGSSSDGVRGAMAAAAGLNAAQELETAP